MAVIKADHIRTDSQSSNIRNFEFHPAEQKLIVEFHSGGRYQYDGVSPADHDAFQGADSHGKHFHARIKGKFAFKKLN